MSKNRNPAAGDLQRNAAAATRLLKALANERRLMVMCNLLEGEQSVGQLAVAVGLSQSALSQHLAKLRDDGFVATRRDAQTIWYSLAGDEAPRLIGVLAEIFCPPGGRGKRKA